MSYQLPSERESPLVVLRAVLLHAARKNNLAFLSAEYEKSKRCFNKRRFFIYPKFGHTIRNTEGEIIYRCVWIDPYNYDVLVQDYKNKRVLFINAYKFLI